MIDARTPVQRLRQFTLTELAEAMGVARETARRSLEPLIERGIVEDTGERKKHGGPGRPAPVFRHVPPPPGPSCRPRRPPPEVEVVKKAPKPSAPVQRRKRRPRVGDPELRRLIGEATAQSWTVEATRNNHIAFLRPDGIVAATTGSTPSDWRAILNLRAELRKAGLSC